jgi:integrase
MNSKVPAVEVANESLERGGHEPLQIGLTPHSLRRTFASLLYAIGETPPYVMAQMGHTSPNLALAIYAKCMDRRDGEPKRLEALVKGHDWAPMGTSPAAPVSKLEVPVAS